MTKKERVVLAYSGGLDTSVAIPWLQENYHSEVIALTLDLGQGRDLDGVQEKARAVGAVKAIIMDVREEFVHGFVWPALQAGALYESRYPLATALGRPLIARRLAELALEEGAQYIAHGCTGKGNDQVRIELGVMASAPHLKVIAPARDWGMSRDEEMQYAQERGIPVPTTRASPYSVDENLWGRSVESGVLEDPWVEPPEDVFTWTNAVEQTPDTPLYLEIEFVQGIPVAIDGEKLDGVSLIQLLNVSAGQHGVGRIDHLENRLVGIKSREIYEAPAAVILHAAHQSLESLTLTKEQQRFKAIVAQEYADLVYNGLWFSDHRQDLDVYVSSSQRFVSGTVRLRLYKGAFTVVGRQSPTPLYSYELATYDKADQFDHRAAAGFIKVYGLTTKTQAERSRSNTEL